MKSVAEFYSEDPEKRDQEYSEASLTEEFLSLREEFVELCEENDRILDAGCGQGRDSDYFFNQGLDPIGIDLTEGSIEYAKENKKGSYQVMDIRDLKFSEDSFSGVWAVSSIFFMPLEEVDDTLSEFKRVLNPEGYLYIDFKQGDGEFIKEKNGNKIKEYHVTCSQARSLIEESGFHILEEFS